MIVLIGIAIAVAHRRSKKNKQKQLYLANLAGQFPAQALAQQAQQQMQAQQQLQQQAQMQAQQQSQQRARLERAPTVYSQLIDDSRLAEQANLERQASGPYSRPTQSSQFSMSEPTRNDLARQISGPYKRADPKFGFIEPEQRGSGEYGRFSQIPGSGLAWEKDDQTPYGSMPSGPTDENPYGVPTDENPYGVLPEPRSQNPYGVLPQPRDPRMQQNYPGYGMLPE